MACGYICVCTHVCTHGVGSPLCLSNAASPPCAASIRVSLVTDYLFIFLLWCSVSVLTAREMFVFEESACV